jgi:hypothetical protein
MMLQKIRRTIRPKVCGSQAMGDRDARYQLAGIAEADDSYFGGPKGGGKRGRGTGKAKVIVAVSLDKKGRPGYVKMAVGGDLTGRSLAAFVEKDIAAGSAISSDAYRSYLKAFSSGPMPMSRKSLTPRAIRRA